MDKKDLLSAFIRFGFGGNFNIYRQDSRIEDVHDRRPTKPLQDKLILFISI